VAYPLELYTEVLYHAASSRVQDTTRRVPEVGVREPVLERSRLFDLPRNLNRNST
jgi:hypothetical protein